MDKDRYQLPEDERERTQSILNRALDVEKGLSEKPSITEEHPDGLDLSLYIDEAQLKKKKMSKKEKKEMKDIEFEEISENVSGDTESDEPKAKKPKREKSNKRAEKSKSAAKEKVKTKEKEASKRAERASERERGRERGAAAKRKIEASASKVSTPKASNEKKHKTTSTKKLDRAEKSEPIAETSMPTRSSKTRSKFIFSN